MGQQSVGRRGQNYGRLHSPGGIAGVMEDGRVKYVKTLSLGRGSGYVERIYGPLYTG